MKENELLRAVADKAKVSIEFKDEKILPGTGWINKLPIDIIIKGNIVGLNSVGKFQGDRKSYSRCEFRGKGIFKALVPHFKEVLIENNFEPALYLLPLTSVWEKNYDLVCLDKNKYSYLHKIIL